METTIFQNRGDIASSVGFGEGLLVAGELNKNIVTIGADITHSVKMNLFAEKFPQRFYSILRLFYSFIHSPSIMLKRFAALRPSAC